ncbi:MAG: glutaminyl-peptide cyclotransferase [Bryobacteraceae bacterium]
MLLRLTATPTLEPAVPLSPEPAPIVKYDVVAEYPHDSRALTQGLIYRDGFLYESIGGPGQSSIRKVELETGRVLQQHAVDSRLHGEGLTEWRGQLIQLTPRRAAQSILGAVILDNLKAMGAPFLERDSGVRYDIDTLAPKSTFGYNVEGWGLTHDDHQFIKSDGTSILRFLNADTMKWQAQIAVVEAGKGIRWLNELEYIDGEVYANIWQQDRIAIIQLNSGQVTGWIDLSSLRPRMVPPPKDVEELGASGKAVANGIAYDAAGGRLFVTGKNWPKLFQIRLRD